jgi:diguanylate cyclase (GGDEF)-like protein
MTALLASLANMTSHRNRELLDLALAEALMDVISPQCIVFVTLVHQGDDQRWLERARFERGHSPVLTDPMWADFSRMPPVHAFPHRWACVQSAQIETMDPPEDGSGIFQTLFPIRGDEIVESVLEVHSERPLDEQMLQVVHSMQKVYRNMQSLLDYSERDSLTGLLNRKSFDDAFFKALRREALDKSLPDGTSPEMEMDRRHVDSGEGYWLAMLDIDHFKRVNDTYGHLIGDEVLLLVARLLRHGFRFHDRLYRFGGEEFVVLMRCPSAEVAQQVFQRFRQSMETFAFPQVGTITVSIGISELQPGDTPAQALDRADQAVYAAKTGGRNRVIDHAELVRQGRATAEVKSGDIELF